MRVLLPLLTLFTASCGPDLRQTHFESGQVWTEIEWSGDRRHGAYRVFHGDGDLEEEGSYVAGVPDGFWCRFYPGGQPAFEENWEDGLRHGPTAGWHEDGTPRFTGQWSRGDRVGIWEFTRLDGSPDMREEWDQGTRVTMQRF